jgi:thiosulfate/3-mercaptopyruvate sulfurtransferase
MNLLITTDWLAAHLNDPKLRIIDIRGHVLPASAPLPHYYNHRADYEKAHLPGAVFIDWVHEITNPDDPRHAKIAKPSRFAEAMARAGISDDTQVIVYDDASGMFAARLWWSLNYYGHAEVAVLDGGWNKWIAEERPTDAAIPVIQPGHFTPQANPDWFRSGEEVAARLHSATRLVDVRTPDEFAGVASRASRKGHIPGAVNLPRTDLITPDGTLCPAEELREKFAEAGVNTATPETILYCNGGVSASFGLLAMKAAGLEHGAVYDGSWKDWGNDPDKPIA